MPNAARRVQDFSRACLRKFSSERARHDATGLDHAVEPVAFFFASHLPERSQSVRKEHRIIAETFFPRSAG